MVWFSPATVSVAEGSDESLRVTGPGYDVQLTGALALDFLRTFRGDAPVSERLEFLASTGLPANQRLLEAARGGDARPWLPLTTTNAQPMLFLEVVGRCNERCVHCYADSAPEVDAALDRQTCERVIREAARAGFQYLQLTGGDPLLCAFLPDLARVGREAGFGGIEVYTNGLALSDSKLESLAEHGVDFAFSFYSHDPGRHDQRTRVPGSQRRTADAIARAVRRGLDVRVSLIAFEDDDVAHFERTQSFVEALGVPPSKVRADNVHAVGRGVESASTGAALTTVRRGHAAAEPDDASPPHPKWPGKLCVSYTGVVYPCIFARTLPLGDVAKEPLSAILDRIAAAAKSPRLRLAADERQLACFDCQLTARAFRDARSVA
jgi:MoaA/NifB/PqqE/SkfB family radical SAM enzyme